MQRVRQLPDLQCSQIADNILSPCGLPALALLVAGKAVALAVNKSESVT